MRLWTRISNKFKNNYMRILEIFLTRSEIDPSKVNLNSIKKILVVRQHDQLGDFLLATPVLRALREHFPDAQIALITRSYTNDVAKNNQYVDEFIFLFESGFRYTLKWLTEFLRKLLSGYDLAIVLNTVSHSLSSDILAYLSRAKYILGSGYKIYPGCQRNFFYNLIAPYDTNEKHQTDRNLDIVRYLGIDTREKTEITTITPKEKHIAQTFLAGHGILQGDHAIGIHPGAGKIENRWPVEQFAEVANYFYKTHNSKFIITWGPAEQKLGNQLLSHLEFKPVILRNVTLRELAAIISELSLFICNDTGIMHLAASVGTPLVAIFGPTNPDHWKPIGDKFIAMRTEDGKCSSVTSDQVIEAIKKIL